MWGFQLYTKGIGHSYLKLVEIPKTICFETWMITFFYLVAESFVQLYFGGQGKRISFTYCNDMYMVHIRFCAALCSWICLVWPETKFRGKSLLKFVHNGQKFIRGSMNSPSSGTLVCILLCNLTSFMFILESSRLHSVLCFFIFFTFMYD